VEAAVVVAEEEEVPQPAAVIKMRTTPS